MIKLENVTKTFKVKGNTVTAVDNVSLDIEKGEIFGIIGFSGAGKSTLVRCMNLLEIPTSGSVFFDGHDLVKATNKELRSYRRKIGMIFQQFNLLEQRTVLANVCYPLELEGVKKKEAREKARELLKIVDLADKENAYPSQLSGGQKQRVAIARALATNPEVLLCDEATSALDPLTTRGVLTLIQKINKELGVTIVVITHEMKVVEQICDRVAIMNKGVVEEVGYVRDIFLNPQSETSRKLVLSGENKTDIKSDKRSIRIVFDGFSSSEPILADLILETQVKLNILGANTEDIGGSAYGQLIIERPDERSVEIIRKYLNEKGIKYEEINLKQESGKQKNLDGNEEKNRKEVA
ncbi:D-methionine transport system ATP-binding protein [Lachnospiraceae bacterium]|nr:D-methionine transport system ATP-binding protein [Lachnospiraceae bacterium]